MTVESHHTLTPHNSSFHAEDIDQVENYRTMSKLAIVSLLCGLAAPVCFLAPLLFSVPIFGAVLSIAALRHIANNEGRLAGRAAATCGLALCIAAMLASISHTTVTKHLRTKQAAEFGQQWISLLLAGKTEGAFRLTVNGTQPAPQLPPGESPVRQTSPYEQFTKNALIETLVAAGEAAAIHPQRTLAYESQPRGQCIVVQEFQVAPQNSPPSEDKASRAISAVVLTLVRSPTDPRRAPQWLVRDFQNP